ncbi:integration host factor subunit beta [Granulicella aggregans]|uniref:Integration host factor subunit beta n=1 Tax=Granulicella aggregans TaxID=474949 RepID=A0A7W8E7B9_9BACT|nr:HU family DNA-binding protein [Granulicella aggregans]MBB5061547.1 integration host factor subunit beta [Granulicella aggregans]
MTRVDLVKKLLTLGDLTPRNGEVIVDTILNAMVAALQADDKVEIRGFGSFHTRKRSPRIGRNPKTGARVEIPAKRVAFFRPSKNLRSLVDS